MDALDAVSWSVIAHDIHEGSRMSAIMASAYLGQSSAAWFALALQAASCPHETPFRELIAGGLADSPEVMVELQEAPVGADADETRDVLQFIEECSQRETVQV